MSVINYKPGYEGKDAYLLTDQEKAYYFSDIPKTFHRVIAQPLDIDSTFNSNKELFDYLKSGASYDGQLVCVQYKHPYKNEVVLNVKTYSQLFKIQNNIPVPILPGGELILKKSRSGSNIYALAYYTGNNTKIYTDQDVRIHVNNNDIYSILPICDIFKSPITNTVKYVVCVGEAILDNPTHSFDQNTSIYDGSILDDSGTIKASCTKGSTYRLQLATNTSQSSLAKSYIIPFNSSDGTGIDTKLTGMIYPKASYSSGIKIYVDVTEYLAAVGSL